MPIAVVAPLLPFLFLGSLVQRSESINCVHSFNYTEKNNFKPPRGLLNEMRSWGLVNSKNKKPLPPQEGECHDKNAKCQTYRCKAEDGSDLFLINGCVEANGRQCSYSKVDQFCSMSNSNLKCEPCDGDKCNANQTKLHKPPACAIGFRHADSFRVPKELKDKLRMGAVIDYYTKTDEVDCKEKSCQTYRCIDENRNNLFVFGGCAIKQKCYSKFFDQFCKPVTSMKPVCKICEGRMCNKEALIDISGPPPPTPPLPPPPGSDGPPSSRSSRPPPPPPPGSDGPPSSRSSRPPPPPPPRASTPPPADGFLGCLVQAVCHPPPKDKPNAKISGRFSAKCAGKKPQKRTEEAPDPEKIAQQFFEILAKNELGVFAEDFIAAIPAKHLKKP